MHIHWLGPRGHFSLVFYVSPLFAIDQQNLARGAVRGNSVGLAPTLVSALHHTLTSK